MVYSYILHHLARFSTAFQQARNRATIEYERII